jgi:hypothetical protein
VRVLDRDNAAPPTTSAVSSDFLATGRVDMDLDTDVMSTDVDRRPPRAVLLTATGRLVPAASLVRSTSLLATASLLPTAWLLRASRRGVASALRRGVAEFTLGVAADVGRRGDRSIRLIATRNALVAVGTVPGAVGTMWMPYDSIASAAGLGLAEDSDSIPTQVRRRGHRRIHLVAARHALLARGVLTARAQHGRVALAVSLGLADDGDGIPTQVRRRRHRRVRLVTGEKATCAGRTLAAAVADDARVPAGAGIGLPGDPESITARIDRCRDR